MLECSPPCLFTKKLLFGLVLKYTDQQSSVTSEHPFWSLTSSGLGRFLLRLPAWDIVLTHILPSSQKRSLTALLSRPLLPPPYFSDPWAWLGCRLLRVNLFLNYSPHTGKHIAGETVYSCEFSCFPLIPLRISVRQRNADCVCILLHKNTHNPKLSAAEGTKVLKNYPELFQKLNTHL